MSRTTPRAKNRPKTGNKSPSAPVLILDPVLEKQIRRMVGRFVLRILLIFALLAIAAEITVNVLKLPENAMSAIFAVTTFGIMIPFLRGADRIFQQIRQIGKQSLEQRRYADARYALEYFHRFGNMSFDVDGEGHYHLVRAYLALHEMVLAQEMVVWLQKYRKRSEWPAKAAALLESAQKRLLQAESSSADTTGEIKL